MYLVKNGWVLVDKRNGWYYTGNSRPSCFSPDLADAWVWDLDKEQWPKRCKSKFPSRWFKIRLVYTAVP